ncbi:FAD-binding oxidoreductase [Listeria aquatica]|uniref:FAD-binding oxidoreductase n=1 Tax=Listeria aquatica TaxID=1494960 RepID=A0A841ZIJ3_9LIST|nr:FAD-dependent oxidoreductase [Listeria aquatica]MBC1520539.1 FAD-binding oxidoreductase [Listeria aquatica]
MKFVVIGSGIVGASAAYHLARNGHAVTIVDRKDAGQATEHAAGIICPWVSKRRNKVWYELAKASARFYPELDRELADLGLSSGYKQVGALCLRKEGETLDALYELAKERKEEAPEMGTIEKLTPEEVKKCFPLARNDYGAVFLSGGGRSKGALVRDALLEGASLYGAQVIHGDASLDQKMRLTVDGRKMTYDRLLLATGAWLNPLLNEAGYSADLLAQKGQLLSLHFEHLEMGDWPVILPPASKSIVPFDGGNLLLGATHEKETQFDLTPTKDAQEEILTELAPFIQLDEEKSEMTLSVGTRPYTSDFTPFIGEWLPNQVFLANGLGASGLTTGPFVGKMLARLAANEPISFNLTPFDPKKYIQKR